MMKITLTQLRMVFIENDIAHPMKVIFNRPVLTDKSKEVGSEARLRDKEVMP